MKKLFLTLAAVAAFSFTNAQIFVGGSLGFSTESGSSSFTGTNTTGGNTTTTTSEQKLPTYKEFSFAPKVGYYLNDKLAVGIGFGIDQYREINYDLGYAEPAKQESEYNSKEVSNGYLVGAFARYHFAEWNNFSLFGELSAGVMIGNSKTVTTFNNEETTFDGPKNFGFGISLTPGIAYKVNDHIQLEATLDVFGLNYTYAKKTSTSEYEYGTTLVENEYVNTASEFGFGIDTESLFNVGSLTIGFVYKF